MSSSTYFQYHGNSEIQTSAADGLQTLIFMNPATYNNDNNNNNISYDPQQASHNFPNYTHQQQQQQQQDDPTATYNFRGFFPNHNVHNYSNNLFNPQIDSPRAQRGLSLSLQPHQGYGSFVTEKEAGPSQLTDDVKSPSSSVVSVGLTQSTSSVVLSSKYLKAAQEILDEVVNAGSYGSVVKTVGKCSTNAENGVEGSSSTRAKHGTDQQQQLSTAERQEIQMKKAKLLNMLHEVEQRYKQYYHQMQIVISWFEQATRTGSAKTYTDLALQTISKQFRSLKDAILAQIRNASKSLGEEESSGGKAEGSRLKYVDNQIRQQRALQQLGMVQHNAWRPQRGLPERSVSVLRAWLFEHFLHPYPKDSDKIILAKQTGLTRSQVSNWFINARVRLWKPMVEEMYKEEMKGRENNGSEDHKMTKSEENLDSASKSTAPDIKTPTIKNQNKNFTPKQDNPNNQNTASLISMSTSSTSLTGANNTGFSLIGFSEMDSITQGSPKKPRNPDILHSTGSIPWMNMDSKPNNVANDHMSMKFGDERQSRDEFSLMGAPTNFIGGFGSYPIAELGRFGAEEEQFQAPYSGNGVSLTLGLPHCENLSMAGSHQSFIPSQSMQLGRGLDSNDFNGMTTPTSAHSTNAYEEISIQNRKRFATELLPDFIT